MRNTFSSEQFIGEVKPQVPSRIDALLYSFCWILAFFELLCFGQKKDLQIKLAYLTLTNICTHAPVLNICLSNFLTKELCSNAGLI